MLLVLALGLIELHGPGGQVIALNPRTIVTARPPRHADHFSPGTKCVITTVDGKTVYAADPCGTIRKLLEDAK